VLIMPKISEEDECDNWIQSPNYGFHTSQERKQLVQRYCKKHRLDLQTVLLMDDVELFVD
jgi:hypothetical protein